jgi:hypothetical protein
LKDAYGFTDHDFLSLREETGMSPIDGLIVAAWIDVMVKGNDVFVMEGDTVGTSRFDHTTSTAKPTGIRLR